MRSDLTCLDLSLLFIVVSRKTLTVREFIHRVKMDHSSPTTTAVETTSPPDQACAQLAVAPADTETQCRGRKKDGKGERCKLKPDRGKKNGFCHWHQDQAEKEKEKQPTAEPGQDETRCRGRTVFDERCMNKQDRKEKNGFCYRHQNQTTPTMWRQLSRRLSRQLWRRVLSPLELEEIAMKLFPSEPSLATLAVDRCTGRTEEELVSIVLYIRGMQEGDRVMTPKGSGSILKVKGPRLRVEFDDGKTTLVEVKDAQLVIPAPEAEGESRVASPPAPAPASNEDANPSASAAADPPEPAPSPFVSSKKKILIRVEGAAHLRAHDVQSLLRELVRDRAISRRLTVAKVEKSVKAQGERPYYLKELPSKRTAVGNAKGHVTEVDHVIECQLVGHAILQTQEFHKVLKELNMGGSPRSMHINRTSEQPFVVQNALKPIKQIQNCEGDEYNCFNLRLMSKSLNITKGKAITRWIESRQKWSEGKPLPRVDLQDAFGKCTALKNGEIEESEALKLAAELQKSLKNAASDFEGFLQTRAEKLDKSSQEYKDLATRLEKLGETIGDLRNEFENE